MNLKIGAIKASLIRMTSQFNMTNAKLTKVTSDFEEITSKCDQLQIDLTQQQNIQKQKDCELNRLTKENGQLMKSRDVIQKRIQMLDSEKIELGKEVMKLRYVRTLYMCFSIKKTMMEFLTNKNQKKKKSLLCIEHIDIAMRLSCLKRSTHWAKKH